MVEWVRDVVREGRHRGGAWWCGFCGIMGALLYSETSVHA